MWYEFMPKLLNMSITGGIIILAVLAARFILRRAPKIFSYALWAVVLFRLLCPVSFSSPASLLNLFPSPSTDAGRMEYIPEDVVRVEYPAVTLPSEGISDAVNDALPQGEEQLEADPMEATVTILTYIWFAGAAALIIYSVVRLVMLRRALVGAAPLRENIYLADHITSPFVLGLFSPKIYLPSSLSEREQGYILLHERKHIKRGDHIVRILAFAALCIHWFNPLVWVAFILSGTDMEMSCDEAVMRELGGNIREEYSRSLLSLATGRRIIAGAPLAFGEGDTKKRIKNVLNYKKPAFWVIVACVIACIALIVCLAANPTERETIELRVIEVHDGYFLAVPLDDSQGLINVPAEALTPEPGDIVEVVYEGGVQETYPAKFSKVISVKAVASDASFINNVPINGLRWGMTEDEVINAMGGAESEPCVSGGTNIHTQGTYSIYGVECEISLFIDRELGLTRINGRTGDPDAFIAAIDKNIGEDRRSSASGNQPVTWSTGKLTEKYGEKETRDAVEKLLTDSGMLANVDDPGRLIDQYVKRGLVGYGIYADPGDPRYGGVFVDGSGLALALKLGLESPAAEVSGRLRNIEAFTLENYLTGMPVVSDGGETFVFSTRAALEYGTLDDVLDIAISREPVSRDRGEDRPKPHGIFFATPISSRRASGIYFNDDFTEVWVDTGVTTTLTYKVMEPKKVERMFTGWLENRVGVDELRGKYSEYFDLNTTKGLEVYVWQFAEGAYYFGLLPGTNMEKPDESVWRLKGASAGEMRLILSTYDIDESDIHVVVAQHPLSSYMITKELAESAEYINNVRAMLGLGPEAAAAVNAVAAVPDAEAAASSVYKLVFPKNTALTCEGGGGIFDKAAWDNIDPWYGQTSKTTALYHDGVSMGGATVISNDELKLDFTESTMLDSGRFSFFGVGGNMMGVDSARTFELNDGWRCYLYHVTHDILSVESEDERVYVDGEEYDWLVCDPAVPDGYFLLRWSNFYYDPDNSPHFEGYVIVEKGDKGFLTENDAINLAKGLRVE